MTSYLRIPFEEKECERIEAQLSLQEQKQAIIRAFNDKVETAEDEDELAKYDTVRDIRNDESLQPAERKRRIIRAKRKGLPR